MKPCVSSLFVYPIKSCRGIAVDHLTLDDRGPEGDRRFMLVDRDNVFMTAREHPRMVLIEVGLAENMLRLSAPGMDTLTLDTMTEFIAEEAVIWKDTVELQQVDRAADRWFSQYLGVDCRLMKMPQETKRRVNPNYSPEPRLVTLADGYPMLLIGTGSLELLNTKLEQRVSMTRFRPNIVVSGTKPHEEDKWREIVIGDVACNVVKPCERCAITTVDPETGVIGKEPLRTLSSYRKVGSAVLFGQNVIHQQIGTIRLGDTISLRA